MSFHRVLVANRGEIAARVIRTCRRLGIETVLAASEADRSSVPARLADAVVVIGPAAPGASYLSVDAVVGAAVEVGADAVHPGYGFLSENVGLALACEAAGITLIGPGAPALQALGDKLSARHHALAAGLPVVPGGEAGSADEAVRVAAEVGYPVLVKAVGGGGGRGMQLVESADRLPETLDRAAAEAEAAFGDSRVYVERYVRSGRHVEVQVLGDGTDVVHLGDRDCSAQRRYQKLFEEAPAPDLPDQVRAGMRSSAVAIAKELDYRGLGTVEFLYDRERQEYYFLEVNARIQVEHPVTEMVTGIDLVAEQIAVAEGLPLRLRQEDIVISGHAVECRINAEDWAHDFRPAPGTVVRAVLPVGDDVRVDTHMQAGTVVTPHYDSLVAKVIARGADRTTALDTMATALAVTDFEGLRTTLDLHRALVLDDEVRAGGYDTGVLTRFLPRFLDTQAVAAP